LSAAVFIVGCNKDDTAIRTYNAPKDIPAPEIASADQPPTQMPADESSSTVDAPPINWTVPSGWKQVSGAQGMRLASFSVSPDEPKAELTVVRLGAEAAEVLPNVKRWAGQLKLPDVSQSDLPKYVKQTQVSGEQGEIIEMTGTPDSGHPPTALIAAIVPHEGATWFFTLKAPQPVIESQKSNFESFVHSVQFVTGRPAPEADASQAPADNPHAESSGPSISYKLTGWKTPAGWQEQPGANSMRVTSFRIGSGEEQAEVIVSRMHKGMFGSIPDNMNRWRGQVGDEPVDRPEPDGVEQIPMADHEALMLTFKGAPNGPKPVRELLVAMDQEGADFWFIKMLGPESVVTRHQDALKQLLNSMHFEPEAQ
jgi:hypothetical protein